MRIQLVLASASTARLKTLRAAGIDPLVQVSTIDEDEVQAKLPAKSSPPQVVQALAQAKAQAVAAELLANYSDQNQTSPSAPSTLEAKTFFAPHPLGEQLLVLGCDSMLLNQGKLLGKPHTIAVARQNIQALSEAKPTLYTGHCLLKLQAGKVVGKAVGHSAAKIHFSKLTAAEIEAYLQTGEPLEVAGSFTIDGLGGAFIEGIEGDYHGIVGLSLPLVRKLARGLEVFWPDLWT